MKTDNVDPMNTEQLKTKEQILDKAVYGNLNYVPIHKIKTLILEAMSDFASQESNRAVEKDRESRWISIHKKTPKRGELVIVTNIEDKDNIWVCCGYFHKNGLWYNQFETPKSDADIIPTHWQPLPEAPKNIAP